MKRHPGLVPLSHDHHEGLVHALRLSKAAQGERDILQTADDFLVFRCTGLARHFQEEEDVLVPILEQRAGANDAQRVRLLQEHRDLEAMGEELHAARAAGQDLLPVMARLGQALERHIRFEERELFPRLETMLTDTELVSLAQHFTGGPSCGLPNPVE